MDKIIKLGKYNTDINNILGLNLKDLDIVRSTGLPSHMVNRKHFGALKYLDNIPDIISNPDYVGINPNEKDVSLEYVKCLKHGVLVGIKLDADNNRLYVSTMYVLHDNLIRRYVHSGRFKKVLDTSYEKDYPIGREDKATDEPEKAPGAPDEGT